MLPQEAIDEILCQSSGVQDGRLRIYAQLKENASPKENADFIKHEYGIGGRYPVLMGSDIDEMHDAKGIRLRSKKYIGPDKDLLLTWPKVAKRIGELIALDRYLTGKEKEHLPTFEQEQSERTQRLEEQQEARAVLSHAPEPDRGNAEYALSLGSTVHIGTDVYEILSFDSERVVLFEPAFPLFNKEMPRDEFDRKIRENPLNDHLIAKGAPNVSERPTEDVPPPLAEMTSDDYESYNIIKENEPDTLVAFRAGDYFELYGEDAAAARDILHSNMLQREIPGIGTVELTGFLADEWVSNSHRLWRAGRNVVLYEPDGDGGHSVVKRFRSAEYIPHDMELTIDNRHFVVDSVDFEWDKVSLRDVTFASATGFPIFRVESIAFVRSYVEEQQPEPTLKELLRDATITRDGDTVTVTGPNANVDVKYVEMDVSLPDEPETLTPAWEKRPDSNTRARFDPIPDMPAVERLNFHITDDELGYGGPKAKYGFNVAAIRTLQQIETEGRLANAEEQETLSRYVGWGGIPDTFDENKPEWAKGVRGTEGTALGRRIPLRPGECPERPLHQPGCHQGHLLGP